MIELHSDTEERQTLVQQVEKEIVTNKWLNCEEDNYFVEEDSEQGGRYITLVCVTSESYDDKNDKTITEQSIYLGDIVRMGLIHSIKWCQIYGDREP